MAACLLDSDAAIIARNLSSVLHDIKITQVSLYLITPMDRATLLHVKSTILHCPPSIITRQRASVDSKLLCRPRTVDY